MTVGPFFLGLCLGFSAISLRAISTKDRNESGVHAAPGHVTPTLLTWAVVAFVFIILPNRA